MIQDTLSDSQSAPPAAKSRLTLWDTLRGRMSDATTWVSGLLGIVSLSALSGTPIPAPCPCCGGMACPNGAAIQGILGGVAALGLQLWSRIWKKKRSKVP